MDGYEGEPLFRNELVFIKDRPIYGFVVKSDEPKINFTDEEIDGAKKLIERYEEFGQSISEDCALLYIKLGLQVEPQKDGVIGGISIPLVGDTLKEYQKAFNEKKWGLLSQISHEAELSYLRFLVQQKEAYCCRGI